MINGHRIYTIGLFGISVEIEYNCQEAGDFLHFLFQDLPPDDGPVSGRRFEILFVGKPLQMSLWQEERKIYCGASKHALAYILTNTILFECIVDNSDHQALHAAALTHGNTCILLPGKSGSGKSSLAAWLTARGSTYLTDELVLLSGDGVIHPFTRPLSLRQPTVAALSPYVHIDEAECLVGEEGTMVPHRSLNSQWAVSTPRLSCIVFPQFIDNHPATLTRLSNALGCMRLLGCYVNARNFTGHGFSELAGQVRNIAAYELKFGNFSDVSHVLQPLLESDRYGR
jgi:hypothetical protein